MLTELLLLMFISLASCPLAFFWGACPCCGCPCTPATNFQIDISGTMNGACSSCSTFDGTYYLTASSTVCAGTTATCAWKYSNTTMAGPCQPGTPCDGMCIDLIQDSASDTTSVRIQSRGFQAGVGCSFTGGSGVASARFIKSWSGATKDCSVYTALSIPFDANTTVTCDFSGATCNVTQS